MKETGGPIRPARGRMPIIRAGTTPYEDFMALWRDRAAHIDPSTIHAAPRGWKESLPGSIGRIPDATLVQLAKTAQVPREYGPISPVEPPKPLPLNRDTTSSLSGQKQKRMAIAMASWLNWQLKRNDDRNKGKAAETRFHDIYDPRGRKYRLDFEAFVAEEKTRDVIVSDDGEDEGDGLDWGDQNKWSEELPADGWNGTVAADGVQQHNPVLEQGYDDPFELTSADADGGDEMAGESNNAPGGDDQDNQNKPAIDP